MTTLFPLGLLLLPAPLAAATGTAQPPRTGDAELVAEVQRRVETLAETDRFSGTVLIARDGEVLLELAFGEASKRFHVPNTIDTKFNLGSMNKMFTAVCVAKLEEDGKLAYDDPISRWVDETWLPKEITEKVTVHHLLTHTSGLGSYFTEEFMRSSRAALRELDDYKHLVSQETLAFEPGSRYSYSNTGMLLLGVVIEGASGQGYFDFVRSAVYGPAGMENSDSYEMDQPVENLAIGYEPDEDAAQGFRNNLFMHVIKGGPAGGGFSTVRDLNRFANALLEGQLVSVSTLDRLWTDHSGTGYGYGFGISRGPAGLTVGHSGGFPGISADLSIYLDRGYVVACLSNYGNAAGQLSRAIGELIARSED